MENASRFRERLAAGKLLLGTCITFSDPTVTEALCSSLDFVWIDAEHAPLTISDVQGHIMATKGTEVTPLVRVGANDPALVKPVLDAGAAGVIIPLVRTADDVRAAVAACRYPPEGIRGFGPRRPARYGTHGGPEYARQANQSIITIVQIEQAEALDNLEAILAVQGLTSIVIGPQDLAASLGHTAEPRHPDVLAAIDRILAQARNARIPVGIAVGVEPEFLVEWADKGIQWIAMGADFMLLGRAAAQLTKHVRVHDRTPPR